ncbi:HIRAN domain-containing protein [Marinospirillum alkaliphilum]|uniref:HIRAN domain-containing protein n=1 Tax=Marinospirillum alkaliphilum DSM 21637 TaxID=1122209 RepID=A0A1K1WAW9_9GAMM|nr:HIRAN domain-containing protein [Marinospirillum alkaliphilum]SFX34132.1 HIRAN domain-containing protein [Marinospirillum alkaliphilum DSM 21637]
MNKQIIKRRRFLQGLFGLGAGLLAGKVAGHQQQVSLQLQDTRIAGSAHYHFYEVVQQMHAGDLLQLRREPDNQHDARAAEVFWKGIKLGYLPRKDNAAVASLMDRGIAVNAELLALLDYGKTWEPMMIRIWVA